MQDVDAFDAPAARKQSSQPELDAFWSLLYDPQLLWADDAKQLPAELASASSNATLAVPDFRCRAGSRQPRVVLTSSLAADALGLGGVLRKYAAGSDVVSAASGARWGGGPPPAACRAGRAHRALLVARPQAACS
jgi:hypothetical protein